MSEEKITADEVEKKTEEVNEPESKEAEAQEPESKEPTDVQNSENPEKIKVAKKSSES